ncbi:MAG: hypothetical protein ACYC3H_03745 [Bellilinea sp.]
MFDSITQTALDQELFCSENARLTGNEGKARVCARRAAGIAVRALFNASGETIRDPSAFAVLNHLGQLETTPGHIKEAIARLLTRVAPDYTLPIQADIIADARVLIAWAAEQIKEIKFDR